MARALPVALAIQLALAGCNDCDFQGDRCTGDTKETCGGIDQIIGRDIIAEPCVAPNGTCVQEGDEAECVVAPLVPCTAERCEGAVSYTCLLGFEHVQDCGIITFPDGSNAGLTCGMFEGESYCRRP